MVIATKPRGRAGVTGIAACSGRPRRVLHQARKTGVRVGVALSDRALAALQAYIARLGVESDFRRSGAVEAIAGDATPAALAYGMGNTLGAGVLPAWAARIRAAIKEHVRW